LDGANLSGVFLQDAVLRGASLDGASLFDAHLERTFLGEARLDGARLTGAWMNETYLGGATLRGAVLIGTDLTHTHGLNWQQIRLARRDDHTRYPAELKEEDQPLTPVQ
jgi:uncharacterized protein YjbI with pentapeptide repeats